MNAKSASITKKSPVKTPSTKAAGPSSSSQSELVTQAKSGGRGEIRSGEAMALMKLQSWMARLTEVMPV